jgi:hypothetical protein
VSVQPTRSICSSVAPDIKQKATHLAVSGHLVVTLRRHSWQQKKKQKQFHCSCKQALKLTVSDVALYVGRPRRLEQKLRLARGTSTAPSSARSWGRFYETVSAEIYRYNLTWSNLSLQLWHYTLTTIRTYINLFILFVGEKGVQNLRMKIDPKSFRPKWSFVSSIPEGTLSSSSPKSWKIKLSHSTWLPASITYRSKNNFQQSQMIICVNHFKK